ncbi:DUF3789 domain-containing protein [Enterococcus hulanensis]|uniref:DUF3789 domain-containing protein n=1 Tax=Enterococcus hulanensis TaxID=2559929 RepID=UPI0028927AC0|nr:DUF3789 domain-containing protein [Enterococcus hulanensis]MDT2661118.1 DUF3789 domain-containing protein [Enterococcus hulanensis]
MSILIGLLLFFLGSLCGLTTMCLVQAGAKADQDYYHAMEQRNYKFETEKNKEV